MPINSSVTAMRRSRIWKLVVALGGAAAVASVGISGCRDQALPVEPTTLAVPDPAPSRYPTEEEYAEMPDEFRATPGILGYRVDVWFTDTRAHASAHMRYLANYAEIALPLTLLYKNSEVTKTTGYSELASWLPWERDLSASASLGVTGSCGHSANATGIFQIRNQFRLKSGWFEWAREKTSGHASASQPPCPCSGTVVAADYDPYSADENDCASGSGGSSAGSGTQFYPGDYTNGETVSWSTGVGNGGSSACGSAAMVDYVCFDTWNEETQSWQAWGCGYVTTC